MNRLVIVESPSKAKTIKKYLGKGYDVISSVGHIRDLPSSELGVEMDGTFEPKFVVMEGKEKVIKEIKKKAKGKEVILASDMDREGEAIAWHIAEILGLDKKTANRVIFSEITKSAIEKAVKNPVPIDESKVEAQFARRILDRLVGYKISPFLWRVMRASKLSAGRVQSVALRFICELEEKITKFDPEEYWKFKGDFEGLEANLTKISGKSLDKNKVKNEKEATKLKKEIENSNFKVKSIQEKKTSKQAPAPFTTSTLQQTASNRLGFGVSKTMQIAQKLYEGLETSEGQLAFITYMRTDSTRISTEALDKAEKFIIENVGKEYHKKRNFVTKKSNVQDAHEAIRPTYPERTPESLKNTLGRDELRLYTLIWNRFMASQSSPAKYSNTKVEITDEEKGKFLFEASGSKCEFDGFEKFFPPTKKEKHLRTRKKEGDQISLDSINIEQSFTTPPARYTEASLVKKMEKEGIGRPSTYASIIRTIMARKYIQKEGKTLSPTILGIMVSRFLTQNFPKIIQTKFTANMESDLDNVEIGDNDWHEVLKEFYGTFDPVLGKMSKLVKEKKLNMDTKSNIKCPGCDEYLELRIGKFGAYMTCTKCNKNFSIPDDAKFYFDKNKVIFKDTKAILEQTSDNAKEIGRECPKCGSQLVEKMGRFGKFIACSNYPECKYTETLDDPARGKCPDCGAEVNRRRSRKGKVFFTCKNNKYNGGECEFISWYEPANEKCPDCGKQMFYKFTKAKGEHLFCPECSKKKK